MILSPSNLQPLTILSSGDFPRLMVHVHLVTFNESFFQTLVGLPLNSHKFTESRIPLPRISTGMTPTAGRTFGLESFLSLADASFICCQQFLLSDKSFPIYPLHGLVWFYRPQSHFVCFPDWGILGSLFFPPQIPQIYSSLFLKHKSHPTLSLITVVVVLSLLPKFTKLFLRKEEKNEIWGFACV